MRHSTQRLSFLLLAALAAPTVAQERTPWPRAALDEAARLAVQDDGRVKPLQTVAIYKILKLRGIKGARTADEQAVPPLDWLLDCWLRPEVTLDDPIFLVQDSEVLDAIEVPHDGKKKRDRFSFRDLRPGLTKLYELANQYGPPRKRETLTRIQQQILDLGSNVFDFEQEIAFLDFARARLRVDGSEELEKLFGGRAEARLSEVLQHAPRLRTMFLAESKESGDQAHGHGGAETPLGKLIAQVFEAAHGAGTHALLPPASHRDENAPWLTPADALSQALRGQAIPAEHARLLQQLEVVADAAGDPAKLGPAMAELRQQVDSLAAWHPSFEKVGLEVTYYRLRLLDYALYGFLLAFVLAAVSWFMPRSRWAGRLVAIVLTVPTLALLAAITLRCVIRGRPPVTTLYETILFVTGVAVLVLMLVERWNRQRIAISLACFLGLAGVFMANRWELHEKRDTMPNLVAVLDTNFWLSTHVTSITIGYSASLLAAALGVLFLLSKIGDSVLGRLFGTAPRGQGYYRTLSRMCYGSICFGLLFSVVGTILGGIWANYSWGRFWGWDPKENGALMICLWQLALLHGRLGGYLKQVGLCAGSVVLGMITAFSWWHVNQLGVGLHSYGPAQGVLRNLWFFYGSQLLLLAVTGVWWWLQQRPVVAQASLASGGAPSSGETPRAPA